MDVWIVESGEYEQRGTDGIYATLEAAKAAHPPRWKPRYKGGEAAALVILGGHAGSSRIDFGGPKGDDYSLVGARTVSLDTADAPIEGEIMRLTRNTPGPPPELIPEDRPAPGWRRDEWWAERGQEVWESEGDDDTTITRTPVTVTTSPALSVEDDMDPGLFSFDHRSVRPSDIEHPQNRQRPRWLRWLLCTD